MLRQIIIPKTNTYVLHLPNELIGKKVEILTFEIDNDITETISAKTDKSKASDLFADCRIDLSNFTFDRDEANNYE
jgi:hypothetical protein